MLSLPSMHNKFICGENVFVISAPRFPARKQVVRSVPRLVRRGKGPGDFPVESYGSNSNDEQGRHRSTGAQGSETVTSGT